LKPSGSGCGESSGEPNNPLLPDPIEESSESSGASVSTVNEQVAAAPEVSKKRSSSYRHCEPEGRKLDDMQQKMATRCYS